MKKSEESLHELRHTNKWTFKLWEPQKEKKKERGRKTILKNNTWKLPKSCTESSSTESSKPKQDQLKDDHSKTHYNQNVKNQNQAENLKAAREKWLITYKEPHMASSNFSAETSQARREYWKEKERDQPRIPYPEKLSFRNTGDIKTSPDKQKLRQLITTRPVIQEMLKGVLQLK